MSQLTKVITVSTLLFSMAGATVTSIGVDSTAGPNWRTSAQLETDNEYGTAGYVIFGLNEADAVYNPDFDVSDANLLNAYNLPAGISVSTVDTTIAMWSGNAANFGEIEDPGNGNAITNAPVLANSAGTKQFTVTRAASESLRITVMMASGDDQSTEYTVAIDDGSGSVSSNYAHLTNGLAYHVFDVVNSSSDVLIKITSTPENRSLVGIAFDINTVDLSNPSDLNSNGIGDSWEEFYFGGIGIVDPAADEETDGLTNLEEWQNLTNPKFADSDSDGLEDGEEVKTHSTSPIDNDTDDDGYDDKFEVDNLASGFDPLVDDSDEDPDNDGLDNAAELVNSTDAIDPDSDDDTIDDGDEVGGNVNPYNGGILGVAPGDPTDPNNPDSDGDDINDFAEIDIANGFVTDPNNADTDGDQISDNAEISNGSDPTDSGSIPFSTVTSVGVDSTAGPNWRTSAQFETDQEYGTAGYVIFGLNEADAVYDANFDVSDANLLNAYSLPAGISVSTVDTNIGMWSGNAANFGEIEDPGNGNAITNAPVLANSTGTRQFTVTRAASAPFRITVMMASGDDQSTEYTVTIADGSGSASSNYAHVANGLAYHVFDISAGNSDVLIDIASNPENRSLMGIAFDTKNGGLRVTDISVATNGDVSLTWNSRSSLGTTYAVFSTDDLSLPLEDWPEIDDGIDTGGDSTTFVIPSALLADADKLFFFVRKN